ncbi:type I restriction-modification system subunit M [Halobacteriovorax marinus]|uniref:type I restriction-modification system subunit M n=1 Tax=Halobacteriovorax marinus TaxID=97084 RepID=UPI003A95C433
MKNNLKTLSSFIWSVADILRGDFKQSQYGRIILPFTVLRRLEAVLEEKKDKVVIKAKTLKSMSDEAKEKILKKEAGEAFFNTSELNLSNINTKDPLVDIESYLNSFSKDVREIFENFKFSEFLAELDRADILFPVIQKYKEVDLSPQKVSNYDMGLVFEDLIRRFAESSNETAGEHFTPRDMVRLTTSLVFLEDDEMLTKKGVIRHLYDPTCGTGGFLSSGMEYLHELNEDAQLIGFGQELNPESYAICKADMLIKGQDVSNIKLGNTLSEDQLSEKKFDYLLSNPPFGVDWKKTEKQIKDEHKKKGFNGRFGPGLPRVSDGSLLFLMHLVDKMRSPKENQGARIGIILNGSPLFSGNAGGGESEIRRYLFENDLIESIIAVPTDMFFNTGISTYIWILSNNKRSERKNKVQLINASECYEKMRKSLGSKRKLLSDSQIEEIVKVFGANTDCEVTDSEDKIIIESKIFDYKEFGYRKVTIERPLKLAIYPRDKDRVDSLIADKSFNKFEIEDRNILIEAFTNLEEKYLNRDLFIKDLSNQIVKHLKLTSANYKLLFKYLAEHDEEADVCKKSSKVEANSDLKDTENVPLNMPVSQYFEEEVKPYQPDSWIDETKRDEKDGEIGIVGYEISFNKFFYKHNPPRELGEIDKDLSIVTAELAKLIGV